ncbi:glycerate kinase type-2 family protein [Phaeovulum sp.]|uniref:glycerate kinase type-2 family protein n=1 Tax=Phaeovulum sp. TaxID=2934796 RepID=UPI0039E562E0
MDNFDAMARRAEELFLAGVAAADPGQAVARAMEAVRADPPAKGGRWVVIALGKAARAMAEAAIKALPGASVLVVTNYENAVALAGAEVMAAGHPVPDDAGLAAGRAITARLRSVQPEDRVLALISGGGSALCPAPVPGISLSDKAEVSRLLLGSGADIGQMNLVRQTLSQLKGGGWLRLSAAPVVALILSDVPGDDLRVIASGPTVAPIGTRADAAALCRQLGIWARLPDAVRAHLDAAAPAVADLPMARNILVGSNALSLAAMAAKGATLAPEPLDGDVAAQAARIVALMGQLLPGQPLAFGGETTVRLTGTGLGGRNQELALRVAVLAEAEGWRDPWVFLAAGTDGRDGPTKAAGAIVGPHTVTRMRAAGFDPMDVLARNDSNPALAAAGALLIIGATGTNVADLAVALRGPV